MATHDPFDNRGQERTRQQAADAAQEARDLQNADLRTLMGTAPGQRVMWWLMELAGVYRSSFNHSGSVMAFNEGQRNIGLVLVNRLNDACPQQFAAMLIEQGTKHE